MTSFVGFLLCCYKGVRAAGQERRPPSLCGSLCHVVAEKTHPKAANCSIRGSPAPVPKPMCCTKNASLQLEAFMGILNDLYERHVGRRRRNEPFHPSDRSSERAVLRDRPRTARQNRHARSRRRRRRVHAVHAVHQKHKSQVTSLISLELLAYLLRCLGLVWGV